MNCADFKNRLHEQFAPSRLADAPDLAEHASHCPPCRALFEQFGLVSDCLSGWRDQVPEVALADRVILAWETPFQRQERFPEDAPIVTSPASSSAHRFETAPAALSGIISRSPWLPIPGRSRRAMGLAAASVAALVIISSLFFEPHGRAPQPLGVPHAVQIADVQNSESAVGVQAVQHRVHPAHENPAAEVPAPLPESQQAAYYDLAQKAAGALGDVSAFVMTGAGPQMSPVESQAEEATGWIDGLQHQLQPIGRSLDDAFDFLWQAGQSADRSQS